MAYHINISYDNKFILNIKKYTVRISYKKYTYKKYTYKKYKKYTKFVRTKYIDVFFIFFKKKYTI